PFTIHHAVCTLLTHTHTHTHTQGTCDSLPPSPPLPLSFTPHQSPLWDLKDPPLQSHPTNLPPKIPLFHCLDTAPFKTRNMATAPGSCPPCALILEPSIR